MKAFYWTLLLLFFHVALFAQAPAEEEEGRPLDVEDTATSIDLGGFAGVSNNAPVRSVFNLIDVGVLIAGVQADQTKQDVNIARDAAVPVERQNDATVNFRKFASSWRFYDDWSVTVRAQFNTFRELTRTAGPAFETPGYQLGRIRRSDGGVRLSYGRTFRFFVGYTGDQLETPLTRLQAGRIGWRVGRGHMQQILEGGEIGFGAYPVIWKWIQFYSRITLGAGNGRIRYNVTTLGRSDDPRTDQERADPNADPNLYLKTNYYEIVRGKMELTTASVIGEAGIFFRIGNHLALRLGGFYQGYTYYIPSVRGNLYALDLQNNRDQLTPLEYVPTDVLENFDELSGGTFAVVVSF